MIANIIFLKLLCLCIIFSEKYSRKKMLTLEVHGSESLLSQPSSQEGKHRGRDPFFSNEGRGCLTVQFRQLRDLFWVNRLKTFRKA